MAKSLVKRAKQGVAIAATLATLSGCSIPLGGPHSYDARKNNPKQTENREKAGAWYENPYVIGGALLLLGGAAYALSQSGGSSDAPNHNPTNPNGGTEYTSGGDEGNRGPGGQ